MAELLNTLLYALQTAKQARNAQLAGDIEQDRAGIASAGSTIKKASDQRMAEIQAEEERRKKTARSVGELSTMAGEYPDWSYATPELAAEGEYGRLQGLANLQKQKSARDLQLLLQAAIKDRELAKIQNRPPREFAPNYSETPEQKMFREIGKEKLDEVQAYVGKIQAAKDDIKKLIGQNWTATNAQKADLEKYDMMLARLRNAHDRLAGALSIYDKKGVQDWFTAAQKEMESLQGSQQPQLQPQPGQPTQPQKTDARKTIVNGLLGR